MARFVLVLVVLTAVLVLAAPLAGQGTGNAGAGPADAGERPAGTLLYQFGGNRLTSIDVESGRRAVRRVSVAACGPETYVTGGHVVFAELRKRRTIVYSVPTALDAPRTRLGSAHAFVPSATPGRVWLAGVDCHRRGMVGVKEVAADGTVTQSSDRRVPGWLVAAVEDGLVIQRGRSLSVWDPATGRTRDLLGLDAVSAVRGNSMLGCAARSGCRTLAIVDAESAATVVARPSGPYRLGGEGVFSPDGSLVAAPAVAERRWSVALVNTRDGTTTIVPGSRTGKSYPQLSWSASSGWLYFRGPGGRIMAYRPGERRAVTLPFRLPRQAVRLLAG